MRIRPVRLFRLGAALALLLTSGVLLGACDSEGTSLYDPEATGNAAPVVASISPTGVVLAGVDEITIRGENFSPTPADNVVNFDDGAGNSAQGTVLSASATELVVKTPNLPNAALQVRVAVRGARGFSNATPFPLVSARERFSDLARTEAAFGMAVDDAGNLYVSMGNEGLSSGVQRIAPDGSREVWFDGANATYSDLAIGADGAVYGARGARGVFELPNGGSEQIFAVLPSGTSISSITVDAVGNVWAGGNNAAVYRITPDGTPTPFPLAGNVRALEVAGGALYAAVSADDVSRILRFPLSGGALGSPEEVANVTAFNGRRATALAVAASGDVFVGTTDGEPTTEDRDPVLLVPAGGAPQTLYPGVLRGATVSLAYGAGSELYVARAPSAATALTSATVADLFRVETRQPGAP